MTAVAMIPSVRSRLWASGVSFALGFGLANYGVLMVVRPDQWLWLAAALVLMLNGAIGILFADTGRAGSVWRRVGLAIFADFDPVPRLWPCTGGAPRGAPVFRGRRRGGPDYRGGGPHREEFYPRGQGARPPRHRRGRPFPAGGRRSSARPGRGGVRRLNLARFNHGALLERVTANPTNNGSGRS